MQNDLRSLKKTARLAGLLYLIWVITGIIGMIYIPAHTLVSGDALATANKILANEFIFRIGILNDILSITIGIFLLLILYRLFKGVNEHQARLMVILLIFTFPVGLVMDALNIASLMMIKGEVLKTFEISQRQDLAMLFLRINYYGAWILEMFWGLWLFPFGILVYKSGFIPRILGIFLILNGIAYIIHSSSYLLFPDYQSLIRQIATPFWTLGEISITLWLLIKGVKKGIPSKEHLPA